MRRALLIGSQTGALRAIDNDVARMTAALSAHGFACERRVGADARRAGILEGLERLICDTRPGDAALVYYSGHGALALNPEYRPGREAPRFFQFIVPTDIDESGDDDFRGVLNLELSGLLARLTEKTQNVTVVLDCCHAARMCRGPALAKSLTRVWALGLDDHLRALRRRGGPALPHVESNPHAVRLVAAAVNQAAFEYTNPRGERISVLTESLALALRGALGAGETWASIAPRVRARVRGIMPTQRAEVEGPARRVLFELRERELAGALPCALDGDAPALAGGQLAGAEVGDVYELLDGDGSRVLATVIASGPTRARVRLDPPQAGATLAAGALARPVSRAPRRDAVYFDAPARAAAPALASALTRAGFAITDQLEPPPLCRVVSRERGAVELVDHAGVTLARGDPRAPELVARGISNLVAHAHARRVRALPSGVGARALATGVELEWGRVDERGASPLPRAGAAVFTGDAVYLRVFNPGAELLYVSVLDVGVSDRVTLLTASEPAGIELALREHYTLGADEHGELRGLPLWWPEHVERDRPRLESLVVVASDQPLDLRALEAPGQAAADPLAGRPGRRLRSAAAPPRYGVYTVDFLVHPEPARLRLDGPYQLDLRPEAAAVLAGPTRRVAPRHGVRVHLDALARDEPAGPSGLRLDTLVVSFAKDGAPRLAARTRWFDAGARLDRGEGRERVLYRGPARHSLELAVWISTPAGAPTLVELLADVADGGPTEDADEVDGLLVARAALRELPRGGSQTRATLLALELASRIFALADQRLARACPDRTALLRAAHLPGDRYGCARHPARGRLRVGDCRLAYEVRELARGPTRAR